MTITTRNYAKELAAIPLFRQIEEDDLSAVGALADRIEIHPGEKFADRTAVYVVATGRLRILDPLKPEVTIDTLNPGAHFNDNALLDEESSRLVLEAITQSTLIRLPYASVQAYRQNHPAFAAVLDLQTVMSDCRKFLEHSKTLSILPPDSLEHMAQVLKRRELVAGELLISEGDTADEVYLLVRGKLRVFRHSLPTQTLALLEVGAVVGEMAVLNRARRNADVVAETHCSILVMSKGDFLELVSEQQSLADIFDSLVRERTRKPKAVPEESQPAATLQTVTKTVAAWSDKVIGPDRRGFARIFGPGLTLQQNEMDCGPACLSTICRYYGRILDPNQLRRLLNTGYSGTSMYDVKRGASQLGFETFAYRLTLDDLKANHLPAIVNWRGYHWIVVMSFDESRVIIVDPARGKLRMPLEEFRKSFTGYTILLRPTSAFTEISEGESPLKRLVSLVSPYRRWMVQIAVAGLSVQVFQLLIPLLSKFIIDNVVMKKESRWLAPAVLGVALGSAASAALVLLRQRLLLFVSSAIGIKLAEQFWDRLLRVPLTFFEKRRTGDITSRIEDGNSIAHFLAGRGIDALLEAIGAIVYLFLIIYLNWKLSIVAILATFLHAMNLNIISPRLRQGMRLHAERIAETSSHLVESLSGLRTIKLLAIERHVRWSYDNLLARQANANLSTLRYSILGGIMRVGIGQFASVTVLFWGASMVMRNQLSIGSLVAFTILMLDLFRPISVLSSFWDQFQQIIVSSERMDDILQAEPEAGSDRNGLIELPRLRGHLRFSGVSFRYAPESRDVLQHLDLEVRPGQIIAIVGRSGSGKSTLIKLLLGFCLPSNGSITIDGFDLSTVWLPSIRRQVGLVPQDAHIYRDTVRNNLILSAPNTTYGEIVEAAKAAGAHDFISALPQGYDTMLEERGANLSGGQRQRLSMARAILQDPRLLILDEATSALDSETERFIWGNLRTKFKDRTVLMIAHRLSTARHADVIVALDRGIIVEQGTHDELMARRGLYFTFSTQRLQV